MLYLQTTAADKLIIIHSLSRLSGHKYNSHEQKSVISDLAI